MWQKCKHYAQLLTAQAQAASCFQFLVLCGLRWASSLLASALVLILHPVLQMYDVELLVHVLLHTHEYHQHRLRKVAVQNHTVQLSASGQQLSFSIPAIAISDLTQACFAQNCWIPAHVCLTLSLQSLCSFAKCRLLCHHFQEVGLYDGFEFSLSVFIGTCLQAKSLAPSSPSSKQYFAVQQQWKVPHVPRCSLGSTT